MSETIQNKGVMQHLSFFRSCLTHPFLCAINTTRMVLWKQTETTFGKSIFNLVTIRPLSLVTLQQRKYKWV